MKPETMIFLLLISQIIWASVICIQDTRMLRMEKLLMRHIAEHRRDEGNE